MIKKLWNNERLREIFLYCLVGGLTTVVNYVVYFLFTRLVGGEGSSPGLAALIMDDSFQNVGLIVVGTLVAWLAAVPSPFTPTSAGCSKAKAEMSGANLPSSSPRAFSLWSWTFCSCCSSWARGA